MGIIVLLDFLVFMILLTIGVPLVFCFGGALLFMSLFVDISMVSLLLWGFRQIVAPILLTIPLFIVAGSLMSESGIAKYLLNLSDAFVGRIKGGKGLVAVITCTVIGSITGSGLTGVAATGPILIPDMVKEKYPRGYSTALVTASSVLGLLIPPSTTLIIYGWVTQTSILACFLATVLPGLLIALLFCIINFIYVRKMPLLVDKSKKTLKEQGKIILSATWYAIPALSMPIVILGGIYGGIFTPTEAAAVAAAMAVPIGFLIYRGLKIDNFYMCVKEAATSIGTIIMLILVALMLSQVFIMNGLPQMMIKFLFGITTNETVLLILLNLFLFIFGMFVSDTAGMVFLAPLLLPLVLEMGISPVQFSALMCANLAIGGVTPPYANILYLGMRVGKAEFKEVVKPIFMFILLGYMPVVLLITFWPDLSLFLPRLLGYVP